MVTGLCCCKHQIQFIYDFMSALNLESLEIRRLRLDLLLTYKILFGMADIDSHKLFWLQANIKPWF